MSISEKSLEKKRVSVPLIIQKGFIGSKNVLIFITPCFCIGKNKSKMIDR